MNFIDKMIMAIDPQKGLKRYEARKKLEILNTGYSNHGASTTRTRHIKTFLRTYLKH